MPLQNFLGQKNQWIPKFERYPNFAPEGVPTLYKLQFSITPLVFLGDRRLFLAKKVSTIWLQITVKKLFFILSLIINHGLIMMNHYKSENVNVFIIFIYMVFMDHIYIV